MQNQDVASISSNWKWLKVIGFNFSELLHKVVEGNKAGLTWATELNLGAHRPEEAALDRLCFCSTLSKPQTAAEVSNFSFSEWCRRFQKQWGFSDVPMIRAKILNTNRLKYSQIIIPSAGAAAIFCSTRRICFKSRSGYVNTVKAERFLFSF